MCHLTYFPGKGFRIFFVQFGKSVANQEISSYQELYQETAKLESEIRRVDRYNNNNNDDNNNNNNNNNDNLVFFPQVCSSFIT